MEKFKKYLNELLSSKKQIALGVVGVLLVGANYGWYGDFFTIEKESSWSSDIPAIQRMLDGEKESEATGDNQLDEAYNWILENVDLTSSDGVIVSVERSNDSVKIVYTYDEELTALLNENPLSEADIITLAEELAPLNEQIMGYLEMVGITDINLDMDVRDSEGHVYLVIRNGQLLEYTIKEGATSTKRDIKEEKQETKKEEVLEGTCIYCNGPLDADDKKSVCDDCKNDPQINGHFESEAPYGRCVGCNCALLEEGQNYCSQCNEKTGTVCAVCQVPLRHYHELGSWKDDFCSQECENHWYEEYARTNQKDYCDYCGKETTVGQTETWGGCCSEACAVGQEGDAYEEWESQYPNGQCGWCEGRISDEAAGKYGYGSMCSQACEDAYQKWYEENY